MSPDIFDDEIKQDSPESRILQEAASPVSGR